ncbi:oxidoreductase family protein [Mangrovibacterium lignilyticum]|uniref:oxidoreductase family protein n=1 Tax=Mangrovibacterium lignilyticum TaxID=2668052 RepID=UPI0013D10E18|nr:oxidoreductase family protein [Mangrovibacterium lignilyticum]
MNDHFLETIKKSTGAEELGKTENIQNLWSGYGKIIRYHLKNAPMKSVIVKHVRLLDGGKNPRGWNSNLSHERKLKSYRVESFWYEKYSNKCDDQCRVAKCLAIETYDDEVLMVLEDLNEAGFPKRKDRTSWAEVELCLDWLANFHATFLGVEPEGLWETGTYWHLETRPEELDVLKDMELKGAAETIDKTLKDATFKTLVHGDAKLANFCFSPDAKAVAAVDFQYVGGGCGMKDVAYFIGSCMLEEDCEILESQILNTYFIALQQALKKQQKEVDFVALEKEWRALYHVAWTDFHRFLKGWSPGHWKINSYSERITRQVIDKIHQ